MSGRQEQWDGREKASQPDPSDSLLVMTQQSDDGHDRANGYGPADVAGTGAPSSGREAGSDSTRRHRSGRNLLGPDALSEDTQTGIRALAEPARPLRTAAEDAAEDAIETPRTVPRTPPVRRIDPPVSNPKPGSWADLRRRLERLPYGHPSSPYHVDGERKPPPPRLKHLELAPPGREPSATPSRHEIPDTVPADAEHPDPRAAGAEATYETKPSAPAPSAEASSGQNLTEPDGRYEAAAPVPSFSFTATPETEPYPSPTRRPPQPASEKRDSHQRHGAAVPANGSRYRPDDQPHTVAGEPRIPGERSRPPAEPPRTRAEPGRPLVEQPRPPIEQPRPPAEPPRTRAEPGRPPIDRPRPPAERPLKPAGAAASRPDPLTRTSEPTSAGHQPATTQARGTSTQATSLPLGRGPGFNTSYTHPQLASDGSWSWGPARLTQEQVRIAQDGYERFRTAEGRDLFGSYGTSGLTAKLRQVQEGLEHGWLAPQTEDHALLDIDVFRARFADMLRRHSDRSPELLASRVPGALSYAFVFGTDHYADGILLVQGALEARGFELQARKNSWSSVANRCVFTMWHDPLSGLPFEVQFHTGASLEAQHLSRTSASLINDPRIPPEEAASLRSGLASAWAALPAPPGSAQIGDYRRYGGSAPR